MFSLFAEVVRFENFYLCSSIGSLSICSGCRCRGKLANGARALSDFKGIWRMFWFSLVDFSNFLHFSI